MEVPAGHGPMSIPYPDMAAVIPTFKPLPSGYCPSSPQDFLTMLSRLSSAVTDDGKKVTLEWGVMPPDFCETTLAAFLAKAQELVHGYVQETGEDVDVNISGFTFECWIPVPPPVEVVVTYQPSVAGPDGANYQLACITMNDGTVVPIVGDVLPDSEAPEPFGRVQNQTDGLWYAIELFILNDGSIAPILNQTAFPWDGGNPAPRVQNITDGLWYDMTAITMNDGTVAVLCGQTGYATAT